VYLKKVDEPIDGEIKEKEIIHETETN